MRVSETRSARLRDLIGQWLGRVGTAARGLRWPSRRRRSRSAEGHIQVGAPQSTFDPPPPLPGSDISLTDSELQKVGPGTPAPASAEKKTAAKRPAPKRAAVSKVKSKTR